jgi:hypothetical protein
MADGAAGKDLLAGGGIAARLGGRGHEGHRTGRERNLCCSANHVKILKVLLAEARRPIPFQLLPTPLKLV